MGSDCYSSYLCIFFTFCSSKIAYILIDRAPHQRMFFKLSVKGKITKIQSTCIKLGIENCLPHDILLCKLSAYGMSSGAVQLMASYLSNRKPRIDIRAILTPSSVTQVRSITSNFIHHDEYRLRNAVHLGHR